MANRFDKYVNQSSTQEQPTGNRFDKYVSSPTPVADEDPRIALIKQAQANTRSPKAWAGGINSVARGVLDTGVGVAQAVPHALSYATSLGGMVPNAVSRGYAENAKTVDNTVNKLEENYKKQQVLFGQDPNAFDSGRLIGNVANPINYLGMGGAPTILKSGGIGAAYGAAQPVTGDGDYASKKLEQTLTGGVAGVGGQLVGNTIGRVLNPKGPSKNVQTLLDNGVVLTPGDILGGVYKKTEDALASVPILGSMQKAAKQKSLDSFNRSIINKSLKPIGVELPSNVATGHDAINYAQTALGEKYDALLPKLTGKIDQKFAQSVGDLTENVKVNELLNAEDKQRFLNIIEKNVSPRFSKNGTISGDSIKMLQQDVRNYASGFSSSPNPSERNLGAALNEFNDSFRKMLTRTNKQYASELGRIDNGYAQFKRAQKAASAPNSVDGIFNPTQYQSAVRAADKSKDKALFAKGKAFGQDLSNAAKDILPSSVGNSGTADRLLTAGGIGSLLTGGGAAYLGSPLVGAGLAASSLYTTPGLKFMEALLTKRPEAVRGLGSILRTAAGRAAPFAVIQGSN